MECNECREVLSAQLDGEAAAPELAAAEEHRRTCAACTAFAESSARLHRATRLGAAPEVPDLTGRILARIGADARRREGDRALPLRLVLAAIAVLDIAAALPALLLGDDAGLSAHAARHAGAFALAIGVGFLYVAWRPRRAAGVLAVAAALMTSLVLASVLDVASGRTAVLSEAQHLPEVAGVVAMWLLHREVRPVERADKRPDGRIGIA
jgi:predicted anti-sigma-YlaC factor YlaD